METRDMMAKQVRYQKLQCIFSGIAAISCVAVLAVFGMLLPKASEMTARLDKVLTNLESVTQQLSDADLVGMVDSVDTLVTTSQSGVEQVIEEFNSIDFNSLNKAISDLGDVVEPLANFFNLFNKS